MDNITLDTTIAELLENYDGMKNILISINPKFKKLNNPILRRTLAKLATVKQAAVIGGMEPNDLVNQLRVAVGQEPVKTITNIADNLNVAEPDWIDDSKIKYILDANRLLDEDKNPLTETNLALNRLDLDSIISIKSDFIPEPLIDELKKRGLKVFTKKIDNSNFLTYIKK